MDAVCGVSACTSDTSEKGKNRGQSLLAFFVMLTLGSESRDSDMKIIRIPGF